MPRTQRFGISETKVWFKYPGVYHWLEICVAAPQIEIACVCASILVTESTQSVPLGENRKSCDHSQREKQYLWFNQEEVKDPQQHEVSHRQLPLQGTFTSQLHCILLSIMSITLHIESIACIYCIFHCIIHLSLAPFHVELGLVCAHTFHVEARV